MLCDKYWKKLLQNGIKQISQASLHLAGKVQNITTDATISVRGTEGAISLILFIFWENKVSMRAEPNSTRQTSEDNLLGSYLQHLYTAGLNITDLCLFPSYKT